MLTLSRYVVCSFVFVVVAPCAIDAAERDWENQKIFGRNKEAPRATSVPFPNAEDSVALCCEYGKSASSFTTRRTKGCQFRTTRTLVMGSVTLNSLLH